jgi:hypothetical protein
VWWWVFGAPFDAAPRARAFTARLAADSRRRVGDAAAVEAIGRRYAEVLLESLGQPGFRELIVIATDMTAAAI